MREQDKAAFGGLTIDFGGAPAIDFGGTAAIAPAPTPAPGGRIIRLCNIKVR